MNDKDKDMLKILVTPNPKLVKVCSALNTLQSMIDDFAFKLDREGREAALAEAKKDIEKVFII